MAVADWFKKLTGSESRDEQIAKATEAAKATQAASDGSRASSEVEEAKKRSKAKKCPVWSRDAECKSKGLKR